MGDANLEEALKDSSARSDLAGIVLFHAKQTVRVGEERD